MVYRGELDSAEVQAIKYLLEDGVPDVKADSGDIGLLSADDATHNNSITYPDGTVVTTFPGVKWLEDGDTTSSGTTDVTYSMNTTYDVVLVFVEATDTGSDVSNLSLQVNGDTGANYNHVAADGTKTTGSSHFPVVANMSGGSTARFGLLLFGAHDGVTVEPLGNSANTNNTQDGANGTVTHPVSQFTIFRSTGTVDYTVQVYGRDI